MLIFLFSPGFFFFKLGKEKEGEEGRRGGEIGGEEEKGKGGERAV